MGEKVLLKWQRDIETSESEGEENEAMMSSESGRIRV